MTFHFPQSAVRPDASAGLSNRLFRKTRLWTSLAALLSLSSASAQPPPPPPFPGGMPTPPPGAPAFGGEEAKRRRTRVPLEAGSTEAFSYRPHPELPGVFIVDMSDGSSIPVGEGYLSSIVRSPQSLEQKTQAIRSYPSISDQLVEGLMDMHYPDPAETPAASFTERTLQGETGESYILSDDPLAKGYVRVSKVGADGKVLEEFTVGRPFADSVLGKTYASDKQKIEDLTKFHPFRLPDDLRPRANDMSTTDLRKMVQSLPALQGQQTFRAHAAIHGEAGGTTGSRRLASGAASDLASSGGAAFPSANRFPAASMQSSRRPGDSADPGSAPAGSKSADEPRRNPVGLAIVTFGCIAGAFALWLFLNRRK